MTMRVICQSIRHTIEVEKSKFICDLFYCETSEQAQAFLLQVKKEFYNASHHTYAYCIGETAALMKASDDGEPSNTAGKPMLDILQHLKLTNIICVVTRYFGGTKLGTGGLIRAYSNALTTALAHTKIVSIVQKQRFLISFDYPFINQIDYLLNQEHIQILKKQFEVSVSYECLFNTLDQVKILQTKFKKLTFQYLDTGYYKQED